jgi:hypothetical protein
MQFATVTTQASTKLEKIKLPVLVRDEAGRAVVAPLTDVHRNAG